MSIQRVSIQQEEVFESYRSQLRDITNPKEKLEKLDQFTSALLSSTPFKFLEEVGKDPGFETYIFKKFTLGPMHPDIIVSTLNAVDRCKKLSEETLSSLEKNYSWSVCPKVDTYIKSKIFQVLGRIFLAKNFANSSDPEHPLYPIYLEMNKFQEFNHGSLCKCYSHIQEKFPFTTERPSEGLIKTV
jgi:hypothetical protein